MSAPMSMKFAGKHAIYFYRMVKNIGLSRTCCRSISLSIPLQAGANWRLKKGEPKDGKRYGPLTDLPDYSFLDGRPTPLGKGQLRRLQETEEMKERIIKLIEEVDFAKENYQRKVQDEQEQRESILRNKLKPKVDNSRKKLTS